MNLRKQIFIICLALLMPVLSFAMMQPEMKMSDDERIQKLRVKPAETGNVLKLHTQKSPAATAEIKEVSPSIPPCITCTNPRINRRIGAMLAVLDQHERAKPQKPDSFIKLTNKIKQIKDQITMLNLWHRPEEIRITMLFGAISRGNIDVVNFLLENGLVSVNQLNENQETSVYVALKNRQYGIAASLIKEYHAAINHVHKNGETILDYVTRNLKNFTGIKSISQITDNLDKIKKLIEQYGGTTAAVARQNTQVTPALPQKTAYNKSFIERSQRALQKTLDQLKKQRENYAILFFEAAYNGNQELLDTLLQLKIDVNLIDQSRRTALHLAALRNNLITAQKIIATRHADVNAIDEYGQTPLLVAVQRGYAEMIFLLASAGHANPEIGDLHFSKPIHHASLNANDKVVDILIKTAKADINSLNAQSETPLDIVSSYLESIPERPNEAAERKQKRLCLTAIKKYFLANGAFTAEQLLIQQSERNKKIALSQTIGSTLPQIITEFKETEIQLPCNTADTTAALSPHRKATMSLHPSLGSHQLDTILKTFEGKETKSQTVTASTAHCNTFSTGDSIRH